MYLEKFFIESSTELSNLIHYCNREKGVTEIRVIFATPELYKLYEGSLPILPKVKYFATYWKTIVPSTTRITYRYIFINLQKSRYNNYKMKSDILGYCCYLLDKPEPLSYKFPGGLYKIRNRDLQTYLDNGYRLTKKEGSDIYDEVLGGMYHVRKRRKSDSDQ